MAVAGRWMAGHFNRPGFELFDFDVYALCGDGCMMEGISNEAASFAGHLRIPNLCWIYDNNHVTIEGHTDLTFSDDVACRFLSYGWNVLRVGDANDLGMLERAFATFKRTTDRPTLIIVDSHIGYGAPHKQDTSAAHGEPLGDEEVRLAKRAYGWPEDAQFLVPDGVREHFAAGVGQARARPARRLDRQAGGVPRGSSPIWPTSWTACSAASCPRAGTRGCRPSRPIRRASPAATRPARC